MTRPSHESDKSLADQFASFLINLRKLEIPLSPLALKTMFILLLVIQNLLTQVSEDAVDNISRNSPTKFCLLDPWPTFLIKECSDIQIWSTAHSQRVVSLMVSKLL